MVREAATEVSLPSVLFEGSHNRGRSASLFVLYRLRLIAVDGEVQISVLDLAKLVGINENDTKGGLRRLEAFGLIEIIEKPGSRGGKSAEPNVYRLLDGSP